MLAAPGPKCWKICVQRHPSARDLGWWNPVSHRNTVGAGTQPDQIPERLLAWRVGDRIRASRDRRAQSRPLFLDAGP